jgi:glycosyltransferase involved in cell wall biosynthesis
VGIAFSALRQREIGHGVNRNRLLIDLLAEPMIAWRACVLIRREKPDVIHAHGFPAVVIAVLARWLLRTPRIVYTHHFVRGKPGRLEGALMGLIYRSCDRWTGVSRLVCDTMEAAFPGLQGRMTTVPNAVADSFWAAQPHRPAQIPASRKIFLQMARFVPFKNQKLVVEALQALAPSIRDRLCVVFAGDGPTRAAIEQSAIGLGDAVCFLGAVEHRDMPALVAAADFGLFPSEEEGFGIAAAECLAAGKPVLALRNRLMQEVLGEAGILVERDCLGAGFVEMMQRGEAMRELARQQATRYRLDRVRDAYVSIYQSMVKAGSQPADA